MTESARRLVGLLAAATALSAVAAVVVWRTATRPSLSAEYAASGEEHDSTRERRLVDRHPVRDPSGESAATGMTPIVAGAVPLPREPLPSLGADSRGARAARAAAILQPPRPPREPPPPKPAEVAIRQRLTVVLERHAGTALAFVTCDGDTPSCRARVEARDLENVAAAARDVSAQYAGHVAIRLHENITGFNGRLFVGRTPTV